MNRDELAALRDAIDAVLTWPDSVRAEMTRWLAPETAKPNGHDPHPPPPRQAKVRQSAFAAKTAEQRLIAAMRDNPGASVNGLAKAAGANRSSTGERLRALAGHGVVTKDSAGHWRLKGDEARPMQPPAG